ncbi:Plant disease resistance response protein [Corchorus olitorius]|uniref:Dirigent protein n=1 Tax=Corchorus olitorius TaxID=93759 RepID=A0A1R3ITT6_9ROSI|nr:Plant disease resistance response protein [Corchorus olitorius]
MATKINFSSKIFIVVLAIFMVMFSIQAKADDHQLKETELSGYFHDYISVGPNTPDLLIVGFPGKVWKYDQFGTLSVFDDLLTEGSELTSPKVGRVQGIAVSVSLDGLNAQISGSLVFTNEAYNGSTIQILGVGNQFSLVQEYGVTSRTGKFRYATGYVTMELISFDPSISYALFRGNVTIRHY